jgi:hypothetical protein
MKGESARDPVSLDPSEAPEWLHDLFNHEGAISCCVVPSPGVRNRIALSHVHRDVAFRGSPIMTVSQLGLPWSVCVISAPQLRISSAEYRGLHHPSRRLAAVVLPLLLL